MKYPRPKAFFQKNTFKAILIVVFAWTIFLVSIEQLSKLNKSIKPDTPKKMEKPAPSTALAENKIQRMKWYGGDKIPYDLLKNEVTSVLKLLNVYNEGFVELLIGTVSAESDMGKYVQQQKFIQQAVQEYDPVDKKWYKNTRTISYPQGPGRGIFQIEPASLKDMYEHYLKFNPALQDVVDSLLWEDEDRTTQLQWNLHYQIAIAAVHYIRFHKTVPSPESIDAESNIWKVAYNTEKGKGKRKVYVKKKNGTIVKGFSCQPPGSPLNPDTSARSKLTIKK